MDKQHQESLHKLKELVEEVKITMFCTKYENHIYSRPMITSEVDEEGNIWFFTRDFSPKVKQLEKDHEVCLAYSNPSKSTYLTVYGNANIIHDRRKMEELWIPELRAWFPKGINDPDLSLIQVKAMQAEFWDYHTSMMVTFYKMMKASLTGKKLPDDGEHGKISL